MISHLHLLGFPSLSLYIFVHRALCRGIKKADRYFLPHFINKTQIPFLSYLFSVLSHFDLCNCFLHKFMARFSSVVLIFMLMVSASFIPRMEGRKLLINTGESNKNNVPSLFASLVLTALPKGTTVPASSPSKKGHATPLDNEKLFARHVAAIDRILQSVPSPGAGH